MKRLYFIVIFLSAVLVLPVLTAYAEMPDYSRLLYKQDEPYLSGAAESMLMRKYGPKVDKRNSFQSIVEAETTEGAEPFTVSFPQTLANNRAADTYPHITQSETTVLRAFSTGVIAAWNDSGSLQSANAFDGWARSYNWANSFTDMGTVSTSTYNHWGDPVLAIDNGGYVYLALLGEVPATNRSIIAVFRSTDSANTFNNGVDASPGLSSSSFQDKPWLDADRYSGSPYTNNVYVCWTEFSAGTPVIRFSRSTNRGASFSAPVTLSSGVYGVQGCQVHVASDGDVHVAWLEYTSPKSMKIRRSTTGGASFGSEVTAVSNVPDVGHLTTCGSSTRRVLDGDIRIAEFPSLSSYPNFPDILTMVYNAGDTGDVNDESDIYWTYSVNDGATWTTPARLNDGYDEGSNDQFLPRITHNPQGFMAVAWNDRRLGPNTTIDVYMKQAYYPSSWTYDYRITTWSFPVPTTNPNFDTWIAACYMGDYDGIAGSYTNYFVSWGDNRLTNSGSPDPDVRVTRVPTIQPFGPIGAGGRPDKPGIFDPAYPDIIGPDRYME